MMFNGFEVWQVVLAIVGAVVLVLFVFFASMARFLKRPSPSEAIIRIGRSKTDVFIGQACWIVPVLHRSSTISLSTIGLTIRRASHGAIAPIRKRFANEQITSAGTNRASRPPERMPLHAELWASSGTRRSGTFRLITLPGSTDLLQNRIALLSGWRRRTKSITPT